MYPMYPVLRLHAVAEAVLVLECESANEAQRILSTLPFVHECLITFEVIPLKAYPGFERLFVVLPQGV